MNETGIRGFRRMDAHEINLMEVFGNEKHARENFVDAAQRGCPAFTIVFPNSDSPLACFGGHMLYPGFMEGWALVDQEVERYSYYYAKRAKFLIHWFFDSHNLRRMQLFTRADQPWAQRWAYYLGFELEGRLRKYGEDGQDYFLFARVRES